MELLRDMHLPVGFRFHPTDTELVSYYLKRKILGQKIEYDLIAEVDIYKHEPWDLPAKCNLQIKDNYTWHFFASHDRKYPTGSRKNRETLAGYWKSTGKDRAIELNKRTIGTKKTSVFYVGRPPSGRRTEWIMHEYYMDENECEVSPDMKDTFVLCRVTKRVDWALDNDNKVGKMIPHDLEQLHDAATSVVSTAKPENVAASVICPEKSDHAATPVGSAGLSNDVAKQATTLDSTSPNVGNELEVWEELWGPSPSFNFVSDTGSADVSLTEQYAENALTSANVGNEVEVWLEELLDPSPSFNFVADTGCADVSLTKQYAESSGMTDSSQATLEAPVSSSLGAMGSLVKKLSLLLAPNYPLRRSLRHAIKLLEEDLEEIRDALMEQFMIDSNKNKVKYWMEEVRELLYDIEDSIDVMMFSHTAGNRLFSQTRRRAADHYIKNKSHRQRVARLKIHRLPNILKLSTRVTKVSELRTLLWEASERHERYQLDGYISNPTFLSYIRSRRIPVSYKVIHNLIGIEDPKKELTKWLTNQSEQQLKILCIVGPLGVGKTTLAKEVYRELSGQFECRAFIRVSRNPDIHRLLQELLSQIQQPKQSSDVCSLQGIIDKISNHLQYKRYFIIIDDLCEMEAWDLMKNAFPKSNKCSRIIVTCEVQNVGAECFGYHAVDIFELKPLGSQDSEKMFLGRVFSSEDQCPDSLKDASSRMLKECGGLPLAIITLAGLFASLRNNSDIWHQLQRYVVSSLTNLSLEYMLKEIVNLCCDNLPQDLKTCLLYLSIYPEGCTIWKVDLVKQWTAEGFITSTKGNEGVAESYFDELVKRGMIQPEKITHNNEVLSCTVHHIVLDLIIHKSREENFITALDYSQTNALFFMKPRRLSLHFSCAQYATKPEDIRLSQVRSLAFFGLPKCMPSVMEFKVLRVLIIEFWNNKDDFSSLDLSRICRLVLLRYLKISGHIFVDFPSKIQGLKLLETLEIFARVSTTFNEKSMEIDAEEFALPNDIVHLPGLLHLSLQEGIKLPDRIGLLTSLQTLKHYDLGNNSEDCIQSLGELTNLRDLHLTCSTALSHEHLKRNLVALASSLGRLTKLESLTLAHGAVGMTMFVEHSSAMFSASMFLQRLEVLLPICIFSRLPEWIGKLCRLSILKIMVRVLMKSDIDILTRLPDLTVLSLYVRQPNIERVVFQNGALPVLKYFKYSCSALCIDFEEAALPNLHRLKLCFNVHRGEIYSHAICSIKHLSNLKGIALRIGAAAGVEESDRRAAESALVSSIHKHPRFPIYMNIRRVDCVDE